MSKWAPSNQLKLGRFSVEALVGADIPYSVEYRSYDGLNIVPSSYQAGVFLSQTRAPLKETRASIIAKATLLNITMHVCVSIINMFSRLEADEEEVYSLALNYIFGEEYSDHSADFNSVDTLNRISMFLDKCLHTSITIIDSTLVTYLEQPHNATDVFIRNTRMYLLASTLNELFKDVSLIFTTSSFKSFKQNEGVIYVY